VGLSVSLSVCVCVCIVCEIYAWVSIVCNSVVLCGRVGKWVSSCVCVCVRVQLSIISSTRPTTNTLTNYGMVKIIIDGSRQRETIGVNPSSPPLQEFLIKLQAPPVRHMYIWLYVYMYVHTHTHTHIYTHIHIYIYM